MPQRKQLIGYILFLALIGGAVLMVHGLSAIQERKNSISQDQLALDSILSRDSVSERMTVIRLHPFDPNTADSMTLLQVGLKPWQIKNMMKYRAKHGWYRTKEDFRKLYGLTDSAYTRLEPYIEIGPSPQQLHYDSMQQHYDSLKHAWAMQDSLRKDSFARVKATRDSIWRATHHPKKDTLLCINRADTNDLQFLRGIGSYTAKRIVWYRDSLGGFVNMTQLREIKGIQYVVWDSVLPHLQLCEDDTIRLLPINRASVTQLQRHPYLNVTKAKAIYTLRRQKISLTNPQQLSDILSPDEINRLTPYLDFSKARR